MKYKLAIVFSLLIAACNTNDAPEKDNTLPDHKGLDAPKVINYSIIAQHPHDTSAYTQGLQIFNGKLYESTGDYENSSLRITDWKTGSVEKKHMMGSDKIFGEGITIFKDKIYQLTWESNIVYVYDIKNLDKPIKTFNWPYEGWGITNNGTELIISDGSEKLYFVNPDNFHVIRIDSVESNEGFVHRLNELEFINGFIYANVYLTDIILKIEPESGHVVGTMNFANILPENEKTPRTDVLNGIAYDSTSNTLLITGKRWPKLFEVKMN